MALRPKIDVKTEKVPINIPVELHDLVKAYAKFLGGDTTISYVYAEAARKEIHSDKVFRTVQERLEGDQTATAREDETPSSGRGRRRTERKTPQTTEAVGTGAMTSSASEGT
jgi:hypothetical protein